jgi:type II secretory pathway pseudopilin PulG
MIEMMITITIILVLFAMLVVAGGKYRQKSMRSKTEGQIQTLGILLENYKSKAGGYPKDGIDDGSRVETSEGTRLQSGAALTFALRSPVKVMKRQPNGELKPMGEEPAVAGDELKERDLTPPFLDDPFARELLDAYDEPFHYDWVAGGPTAYSRQDDGDVHLGWDDRADAVHADDPREAVGRAVASTGLQNVGGYDLWSHGSDGHTPDQRPQNTIANWRVPEPTRDSE